MTTQNELLEALESFLRAPSVGSAGPGSITIVVQEFNMRAAHAAIAKAEQAERVVPAKDVNSTHTPVAWRWGVPKLRAGSYEWRYSLNKTRDDSIPLYTHPAPLRELSDSEILEIAHRKATQYNYEAPSAWVMHGFSKLHTLNFAREVLKAAGGKQ